MKKYEVNIDMVWSVSKIVTAKTSKEAKQKAWAKFCKRVPKKDFTIISDEIEP